MIRFSVVTCSIAINRRPFLASKLRQLSMQASNQFKQAILKNLLQGLRKRGVGSVYMGFHERKDAIKHAADAALASARGAAPRWSRGLQAAELPPHRSPPRKAPSSSSSKMICRRILMRRSLGRYRKTRKAGAAKAGAVLAGAMAWKRNCRALRGIVPGGEELDDECALLGETLDYAVSLRAQVDVMQLLVRALQSPEP